MQHQIQTFAGVFCGTGRLQKNSGHGVTVSSHREREDMLAVLSTTLLSAHFVFALDWCQSSECELKSVLAIFADFAACTHISQPCVGTLNGYHAQDCVNPFILPPSANTSPPLASPTLESQARKWHASLLAQLPTGYSRFLKNGHLCLNLPHPPKPQRQVLPRHFIPFLLTVRSSRFFLCGIKYRFTFPTQ